jgi:hypothetical protein
MTVAELIGKLAKYPGDMLIAIRDDAEEEGSYETIHIEHHGQDDEVVLVIE